MDKNVELSMLNAPGRRLGMFVVFQELTWDILDDLPILDGRSHLERSFLLYR
jgi:hypothetical protein